MRAFYPKNLLSILFFYCLVINSQAQDFHFHHITSKDKLHGIYSSEIFVDSKGLVWIGSNNAVNIYDGTETKVFLSEKTPGLNNAEYFNSFLEDKNGNIWITSMHGIHLYKRSMSTFHFYELDQNEYRALCIDSSNYLWLTATTDKQKSVHRFNIITKDTANNLVEYIDNCYRNIPQFDKDGNVSSIISFYFPDEIGKGIQIYEVSQENNTYNLNLKSHISSNGLATRKGLIQGDTIWATGVNGLLMYNIKTIEDKTIILPHAKGEEISLWDIEILNQNEFLISSDNGLYIFDKDSLKFKAQNQKVGNQIGGLLNSDVKDFFRDKEGNLWISDWNYGISYTNLKKRQFNQIKELQGKTINCITTDEQERIWVSTKHDGVYIFDTNGKLIRGPIETQFKEINNIEFQQLFLFQGEIWGLAGPEFFKWNNQAFKHSHQDRFFKQIFSNKKNELLGDVVTDGLFKIDLENKTSDPYIESGGIHGQEDILCGVYSFGFGKIFISDIPEKSIQILTNEGQVKTKPYKGFIYDLYPLPDADTLLMATSAGLKLLNIKDLEVEELKSKHPLPNISYYDIIDGKDNEVWLASNEGLIKYNYVTQTYSRYHASHGLQDEIFKEQKFLKTSDGKLWIGGDNGLNYFNPEDITEFKPPVRIYFDELLVNDEPFPLEKHIDDFENEEIIELDYFQNSIKLRFASMDHSDNAQVKARYKIEGLNDDWIDCNRKHEITFFQQPAGTYKLMVEATNSEGNFILPRNLILRISPPFWKTWWFCLLALLILARVIYWLYQNQLKRKLAAQEIENLQALNEFKSTVYSNVTHEFKTPITIIQGYASLIKDHPKERQIIQRSSNDLLRLLNQMLDIAKLETGKLSLDLKGGDVIAYLKHLIKPVQSWAEKEQKQFSIFFDKESWEIEFDEHKLEYIIMNLLSNAIKFTRTGGKIEMRVTADILEGKKYLKVVVQDSGVGIAKAYQSQIFERHFQVPRERKMNQGGTGIGLAFCKELVDLMKGKIQVESEEGNGSTFTVWLPANEDIDPVGELVEPKIKPPVLSPGISIPLETQEEDDRPVLLIIEDNRDVAELVRLGLGNQYQYLMAFDGQKGIELAEEHLPDLIVSDVMMPEKNGFEVCTALKNQSKTSHIPIILLTAKDSFESEIAGLKRGADVYLRKPFKSELLVVHLSNQLNRLKTIQSRYENLKPATPPQDEGQKIEDEFLKKLTDYIKSNLSDVSPKSLEKVAFMSSSSLNRKLRVLVGKTPSQFIKFVKLHLGRDLLNQSPKKISEIADEVGFNSADHFSREFRMLFNCSPTEYRNGLNNS